MKPTCTRVPSLLLIFLTFFSPQLFAQNNPGDFRSVAVTGNWSSPGTWEEFNGTTWVTPVAGPTSANGFVTIKSGTTVTVDNDESATAVEVEAGATLQMLNIDGTAHPLTVSDGVAGAEDFVVDGVFSLDGSRELVGAPGAKALINGTMIWIDGSVSIPVTIEATGTLTLTGNATKFLNAGFNPPDGFNNIGTINWNSGVSGGDLALNNTDFTNNGVINEQFQSNRGFLDNGGLNSITNNATITKTTAFTFTNGAIYFDHEGTIQGKGLINLTGSFFNGGVLKPGSLSGPTIGTLSINGDGINLQYPQLNVVIKSAGQVAGTDYDQFIIPDASGTFDLANIYLTLSDLGSDPNPIGTVYTILSAPNGATLTSNITNLNIGSTVSPPITSGNSVTVTKIATLPLTWGTFNALALLNNSVLLNWSTLKETNTSHFVVEHSTDGKAYTAIGEVAAAGNSAIPLSYTFTHANPLLNGVNFYRLRQLDLDGKSSYSVVRTVRFAGGDVVKVLAYPNPVHDMLQLSVQEKDIVVILHAADGKLLRTWKLQPGTQQVSLHDLAAGNYQLVIYQQNQKIQTQQISKF